MGWFSRKQLVGKPGVPGNAVEQPSCCGGQAQAAKAAGSTATVVTEKSETPTLPACCGGKQKQ